MSKDPFEMLGYGGQLIRDALHKIPSPELAYSMCCGQAEYNLMAKIGYEIDNQFMNYTKATRRARLQYSNKMFGITRGSLVVVEIQNEIETALCVFEGKFWFTFDLFYDADWKTGRIGNKLDKCRDLLKKYDKIPETVDKYFLVFFAHYHALAVPSYFAYASFQRSKPWRTHNLTVQEEGFSSAGEFLNIARQKMEFFLANLDLKPLIIPIDIGTYDSIPIRLLMGIARI